MTACDSVNDDLVEIGYDFWLDKKHEFDAP